MELITVNKQQRELSNQLEFLIRKEFYLTYFKFRFYPLYLLIWSVLILVLLFFTEENSFITLKAVTSVLTVIFWIFSLIIIAQIVWKFYKRKSWKQKCLKAESINKTNYQMAFDEKRIYFVAEKYKSEILWNYYKFYSVSKNSIFLIPPSSIYEATCISESEIGLDNFDKLKAMATLKLTIL